MTSQKILLAATAFAASSFLASPVQATVSLAASFDEKVENAHAIVLGRVVKKESKYDAEKRLILTYTTFQVEKTLKGGAPSEVTLVTPGGRVGDVQQTTVGVPSFEQGQESVVFVRNTTRGPTVLYFDQGAYDVVNERGERIVRPVASEAVLIDEQRAMAVAPEQPRTLREFEGAVREVGVRARHNRMNMLERQRQKLEEQASIGATLAENKWLIAVALIGVALATIHLIRRT